MYRKRVFDSGKSKRNQTDVVWACNEKGVIGSSRNSNSINCQ